MKINISVFIVLELFYHYIYMLPSSYFLSPALAQSVLYFSYHSFVSSALTNTTYLSVCLLAPEELHHRHHLPALQDPLSAAMEYHYRESSDLGITSLVWCLLISPLLWSCSKYIDHTSYVYKQLYFIIFLNSLRYKIQRTVVNASYPLKLQSVNFRLKNVVVKY